MAKVIHYKEKCIGCGYCAALCPEHWEMGSDGKSHLKGSKETEKDVFEKEVEDVGCNKQAEEQCPTHAIKVEE